MEIDEHGKPYRANPFRKDKAPPGSRGPCKFYLRGHCLHGAKCEYSHNLEEVPDGVVKEVTFRKGKKDIKEEEDDGQAGQEKVDDV